MEEVEEGGLRGPFTAEEIEARHGPRWIAARRFGIVQSEKIRPIDDFSEFSVNAAFGTQEKAPLKSIVQVIAWTRAKVEAVDDEGYFSISDSARHSWEGKLHEDWAVQSWRQVVGRVADLRKPTNKFRRTQPTLASA